MSWFKELAGPIIGGLLGMEGQKDANQANRDIAREQMNFQREMSNTSYQRQVKDLQAAGLNPLLGIGGGGASTPQGASAQMQSTMPDVGRIITSAMEIKQMKLNQAKQNAELDLMNEQKKLTRDQGSKARMETKVLSRTLPEAEAKNMIWDKVKSAFGTSSRSTPSESWTPEIKEFHNKYRKQNLQNLKNRNMRLP